MSGRRGRSCEGGETIHHGPDGRQPAEARLPEQTLKGNEAVADVTG